MVSKQSPDITSFTLAQIFLGIGIPPPTAGGVSSQTLGIRYHWSTDVTAVLDFAVPGS